MSISRFLSAAPLVIACASGGGSGSAAGTSAPPSSPSSTSTTSSGVIPGYTLVATLNPTNASGNRISGTVRLSPTNKEGELRAEIDIRGGNYQNKFPWVVRSGQCGERGEELGSPVNYRLIETKADGMARLNTTVRLTIPEGRTFHVDILAGPTQRDLVVSCGVLSIAT